MKIVFSILLLCVALTSCQKTNDFPNGTYEVSVLNKEDMSGTLEIVGETGDHFGYVTFKGKRTRTFPIGLTFKSQDSLDFLLAGGGYLRMKKQVEGWSGNFKYFGLEYSIEANRKGEASKELKGLVKLKPVGKGVISTDKDETFPCYDSTSKTLCFSRGGKIFETKKDEKAAWSKPKKVSFSSEFNDSAPYVFNNGESMLFTSNRKLPIRRRKRKICGSHTKNQQEIGQNPTRYHHQ